VIPYFEPPVLRILGIELHPFGLLIALGVFIGVQVATRRGAQLGQSAAETIEMTGWTILSGYFGAHVADVLLYHPEELTRRSTAAAIVYLLDPRFGLSSFGGFFAGFLGMVLWCSRRQRALRAQLDIFLFGLAPGWFFGRMGCFLTHDHPGLPTGFWLGVDFGRGEFAGVRHDLGLYEALFSGALTLIFLSLSRRPHVAGFYSVLAMVLYGPTRFAMDFLRVADVHYFGLTPAQYGAVLVTALGGVLLHRLHSTPRSPADSAT
jgi:phosphatidylglycerol:prolipoprotein diacylglycerol transferase